MEIANDYGWINDEEIAEIVGMDWLLELDVSCGGPDYWIECAQEWLIKNGYTNVTVVEVRENEDNLDWYMVGNFMKG